VRITAFIFSAGTVLLATAAVAGDTSPASLLRGFEAQASAAGSPGRGRTLFTTVHSGGKPDTPSCITCHTKNLRGQGMTRAGKVIDPIAPSANAARFTDTKKVAKWFRRNCRSVLGRECSAGEKADVIAFLLTQ